LDILNRKAIFFQGCIEGRGNSMGDMPPMAIHLSQNILLDVTLVIYNFICLIVTISDHESNTYVGVTTKKCHQNFRQSAMRSMERQVGPSNQKSWIRPCFLSVDYLQSNSWGCRSEPWNSTKCQSEFT